MNITTAELNIITHSIVVLMMMLTRSLSGRFFSGMPNQVLRPMITAFFFPGSVVVFVIRAKKPISFLQKLKPSKNLLSSLIF